MTAIYALIGRAVVRLAWWRYGRQIRMAGAVMLAGVIVGGYLLSQREPPEG